MPAADRATAAFHTLFHAPPALFARAPGRVNLIGEHLDYNAGHVLPFALHLDCVVAIGPSSSQACRVVALDSHSAARLHPSGDSPAQPASSTDANSLAIPVEALRSAPADALRALTHPHHWSSYVLGVLFHLRPLLASPLPAFNATIASDVPLGGGLSSSASLEVALARALFALTNSPWNPHAAALACQRAEHDFARVPCGLMDQLTSALARADHALRIDCSFRTPPELIPMPDEREAACLVIDSGVRHALASSEFALRVSTCASAAAKLNLPHLADLPPDQLTSVANLLSDSELRAARHVSTEQSRVHRAVEALRAREFPRLGQLMLESHASLRDDYRVSCPELDDIVRAAMQVPGVLGARMTGGGFGGCAIALAQPDAIPALQHHLLPRRSFRTSPSSGASLLTSIP
jgi:galactokinase